MILMCDTCQVGEADMTTCWSCGSHGPFREQPFYKQDDMGPLLYGGLRLEDIL